MLTLGCGMSRENDIDALIDHLNDAMVYARRLKVPDIILMLSMAAIAILDVPVDGPDGEVTVRDRELN
jgi:hypothetical protein